MKKKLSTFERKMKNPKFKKVFNKGYKKLLKEEATIKNPKKKKHPTLLEIAYEIVKDLKEFLSPEGYKKLNDIINNNETVAIWNKEKKTEKVISNKKVDKYLDSWGKGKENKRPKNITKNNGTNAHE